MSLNYRLLNLCGQCIVSYEKFKRITKVEIWLFKYLVLQSLILTQIVTHVNLKVNIYLHYLFYIRSHA